MNLKSLIAAAIALAPAMSFAADGQAVYKSVCMACHAAENVMVAAPKLGDGADWRRRLARSANGIETLTDHAVNGFGAMPAKGGRDGLSRTEIRDAIAYMMAPSK